MDDRGRLERTLCDTSFSIVIIVFCESVFKCIMRSSLVHTVAYDRMEDGGYAYILITARRPNSRHQTFFSGSPVFLLDATRVGGMVPDEVADWTWGLRQSLLVPARGDIIVLRPPYTPTTESTRRLGMSFFTDHPNHGKRLANALGYSKAPRDIAELAKSCECSQCIPPSPLLPQSVPEGLLKCSNAIIWSECLSTTTTI